MLFLAIRSILSYVLSVLIVSFTMNYSLLFRRTTFAWRTNWKQSTHEVAPWPFLCNPAEYFHLSTDTFWEQDNFSFLILAYLLSLEECLLLLIADDEGMKWTLSYFADGLQIWKKPSWKSYLSPFVKTLKMTLSLDPLMSLLEIYPKAIILNTEKLYVNRNTI